MKICDKKKSGKCKLRKKDCTHSVKHDETPACTCLPCSHFPKAKCKEAER